MPRHKLFDSLEEAMQTVPPGHKVRVEIDRLKICLSNFNGRLHAIQDACPHLGDSLAKGTMNPFGEIVCPWHSYRFNLITGQESTNRCRDAVVYRLVTGQSDEPVYLEL